MTSEVSGKYLLTIRDLLLELAEAPVLAQESHNLIKMRRAARALEYIALDGQIPPAIQNELRAQLVSLITDTYEGLLTGGKTRVELPSRAAAILLAVYEGQSEAYTFSELLFAESETIGKLHSLGISDAFATHIFARARNLELAIMTSAETEISERTRLNRRIEAACATPVPTSAELSAAFALASTGVPIRVLSVRRHVGVNTKAILHLQIETAADWPKQVVMRQDRSFKVLNTTAASEFDLMGALYKAGLPVAQPVAAGGNEDSSVKPYIVLKTQSGAAMSVESIGAAGRQVGAELAAFLGNLHRLNAGTKGFPKPVAGSTHERTLMMVETYYSKWREVRYEPSVLMEAAYAWLRRNVECLDERSVLVHGDFDLRNVLIENGHVSTVLDWELAHVGHPAEDLAFCFGDVTRLTSWDEFLEIYSRNLGDLVAARTIKYFEIWSHCFRLTATLVAAGGFRTDQHRDLILGGCAFQEYMDCRRNLAAALSSAE